MKKIVFWGSEMRAGALDSLPVVEGKGEYLAGWDCRYAKDCPCHTATGESDGISKSIQHVCDKHPQGVQIKGTNVY